MSWNQKKSRESANQVDCEYASINLSRYLDNDLASANATVIAAHLHGCLSCRNEFEGMRAQQALLSALPVPTGARAARDRVLKRLEAGVPIRRNVGPVHIGAPRIYRRFATAGGALTACGLVAALLLVGHGRSSTLSVPTVHSSMAVAVSIVPRQLPANDEMSILFELHDKQASANAKALVPPATIKHKLAGRHPNSKSRSLPAVESQDERFSRLASKVTTENLALGQGSHGAISAEYLASDDVPEAL